LTSLSNIRVLSGKDSDGSYNIFYILVPTNHNDKELFKQWNTMYKSYEMNDFQDVIRMKLDPAELLISSTSCIQARCFPTNTLIRMLTEENNNTFSKFSLI
jgi:hypothetical protein